ncbi:MAG TPA: glycine oxidase ThiO [Anaeromyxobacteraceae bacterium]|nr:glycine oxidase ThiO [Anaeromyxobacteraceae bacterium]
MHDVVVIGAGVEGCAVALRLAQGAARVLVIERGVPGTEASSAAGGILSPGVEAAGPGPFYELGRASLARFPALVREIEQVTELHVGFRSGGTLEVALTDERARLLSTRAAALDRHGMPGLLLGKDALLALEPALSGEARSALYFPDEASIDSPRFARALYLAAHRTGARFLRGEVRRIVHEGDRAVAVEHDGGRLEATAIVLAAGAWSGLVEGSGLPARAVRPVRGQMVLLATHPPLLSRVVFGEKGYLVPRADGRLLCGSTTEEAGFEKAVTAGGLSHILEQAIELVPTLAAAPVVGSWSNFRPASPDGAPVLGRAAARGLFYATGHTRNGILLAPITADAVSAAVLERPLPIELAPFSPQRAALRAR